MPTEKKKDSLGKQFVKGWQKVFPKKPGTFAEKLGAGIAKTIKDTPKALKKLGDMNKKRNTTTNKKQKSVDLLSLKVYEDGKERS